MLRLQKQTLVFIVISFFTLCWITGCGKTDYDNSKNSSKAASDITENNETEAKITESYIYQGEEIHFSPEIKDVSGVYVHDDKLYIIAETYSKREDSPYGFEPDFELRAAETGELVTRLFLSDMDGNHVTEIPLNLESHNIYLSGLKNISDGILLLFDTCNFENVFPTKQEIVKINVNGEEEWRKDVTGLAKSDRASPKIEDFLLEGENFYFLTRESIIVTDENFNKLYDITEGKDMHHIISTVNGQILVAVSDKMARINDDPTEMARSFEIREIDMEKQSFGKSYKSEAFSLFMRMQSGDSKYDFYCDDFSALYGYDMATETSVKLMDYQQSGISNNNIGFHHLTMTPDGKVVTMQFESYAKRVECWYQSKSLVMIYTKVDPNEIEDKKILTYCTFGILQPEDEEMINEFNKNNKEYRVEIKDYCGTEDPITQLNMDMIAGKAPDIIDLGNLNLSVEQCVARGILEDLTPYLKNDPALSQNDFLESAYAYMCINEKLYFLAPGIYISGLAGSVADIGTKDGWNFDEMMAALEKKGSGTQLIIDVDTKEGMLQRLTNDSLHDYVDWQTGKCNFDGEEFKKLLMLCNQYRNGKPNDPNLAEEGFDAEEHYSALGDKVMLVEFFADIAGIQMSKRHFGEDIHLIGYPNADRNGFHVDTRGLVKPAIYAKSEHKEAAWELIRAYMTKEYQGPQAHQSVWGNLPTRKDCLELYIEANTATRAYTDEFGNEIEPPDTPASKEDVAQFREMISRAKRSGKVYWNPIINNIILEEAQAYFAGDRSVEEVMKIIQNRVTTYVNEMK